MVMLVCTGNSVMAIIDRGTQEHKNTRYAQFADKYQNVNLNKLQTRRQTDLDLCSGCRMTMPSSSTSVVQSLSMLLSTLAAVTASMLFFPSHHLFNTPSQPAVTVTDQPVRLIVPQFRTDIQLPSCPP